MSVRMRFVLVGVGLFVVIIGWFAAVFRPGSSKLSEVKASVQQTESEIAALEAKLADLQELKRNEEQLLAENARFKKALPSKPGVSDFLRSLEDAANRAGIEVSSIAPSLPAAKAEAPVAAPAPSASTSSSPSPAAPSPAASPAPGTTSSTPTTPSTAAPASALQSISISLQASGTFFQLERFLENLEHLERAMRINTFNLGGGGATAAPGASGEAVSGSPELSISITMDMFLDKAIDAPAAGPTTSGPDAIDRSTGGATQGTDL